MRRENRQAALEHGLYWGYIFPCGKCGERLVICGVLYRAYLSENFGWNEDKTAELWQTRRDEIDLSTAFGKAGSENKMCRQCFDKEKG